jgi:N-acetylneuraminic acid mutarotase
LFGGMTSMSLNDTWVWNKSGWRSASPTRLPDARSHHAMTGFQGGAILFGGRRGEARSLPCPSDGVDLDDTWFWDGLDWSLQRVKWRPTARSDHAMAALGGQVVMFGGRANNRFMDDTWIWDGRDWSKQVGSGPSARAGHAMAQTPNGIVLFGGYDEEGALGDTWIWDGTSWSSPSTPTHPPDRAGHTMSTLDGKTLLVGGVAEKSFTDAWTWDGTTWERANWGLADPETKGKGCNGQAAASVKGAIVGFGGTDEEGQLCESWLWVGGTFSEPPDLTSREPQLSSGITAAFSPSAMVSTGSKVLLFLKRRTASPGVVLAEDMGETWEWSSGTWRELKPPQAPRTRTGHAMAAVDQHVVLFGGSGWTGKDQIIPDRAPFPVIEFDDTWEWDGHTWIERNAPSHPPGRERHAMASVGRKVLLFGGIGSAMKPDDELDTSVPFDDTWEWNDGSWTRKATQIHPPAGPPVGMATVGDRIFLVAAPSGGKTTLWQWANEGWAQVESTYAPDERERSGITSLGNQLLLVGGATYPQPTWRDTWTWSNGEWSSYPGAVNGPEGPAAAAVAGNTVVLVAGTGTWTAATTTFANRSR